MASHAVGQPELAASTRFLRSYHRASVPLRGLIEHAVTTFAGGRT